MISMLDRVKGWLFEEDEEELGLPPVSTDSQPAPVKKRKNSILSLHNARGGEEIFIRRPRSREDAPQCADCLRAGCPVIVNLKSLDSDTALRIFDFLAGVVYAIGGQMEAVGEGIFLLTPREVDIASDVEEEATAKSEESGFWQEN